MVALNCRSTPIHFVNLSIKKTVLIAFGSAELWMKMNMDSRQHKTKCIKMCPRRFSCKPAFLLLLLRTSQTASRHPPCRPWATMYHLIQFKKPRRSLTKHQIRDYLWKRFGQSAMKNLRRNNKKTQPGHGMTSTSSNQPRNGVTSDSEKIVQEAFCWLKFWLFFLSFSHLYSNIYI